MSNTYISQIYFGNFVFLPDLVAHNQVPITLKMEEAILTET